MPRNRTRRRSDSTTLNGSSSAIPPRSKAGCWTCRIRRKRCDEQPDDSGACQACVRLDIECLGWGTRRPDWCRDKEQLNQYKLSLKRKLCSRAGTRPSGSRQAAQGTSSPAGNPSGPSNEYHEVTRAPSGESPRVSSSSVAGDEELETGKWVPSFRYRGDSPLLCTPIYTDDYNTPFTPATNLAADSPLFFSPHSQLHNLSPTAMAQPMHYPKQKLAPLSVLAPNLHNLLAASRIPAEYANIASQLIDLHLHKSRTFSGATEQEVAHRAQIIETELNRLSNRASFDNMFSSALGFEFDSTSFLGAAQATAGYGGDMNQYSSPMAMWSPDLMSDAMSTFSGSSAPTSPAAPLLAMASNSYSFGDLLGYDNGAHMQQSLFESSYMPMQSFPSPSPQQSTTALNTGMGALGLSSDYMFNDMSAYNAPAISLLPPTRTSSMDLELMASKAAPVAAPASSLQDVDPFQIHHETCVLLLQAILSNDSLGMSSFDTSSPFNLDSGSPLEDCLQRLTSKFSPISQQRAQGIPVEYLFGATLAGAMSSAHRRAFFREIVSNIEVRMGMAVGSPLLNEVWSQ